MKRMLLPAALLVCAAACAPAPTENSNANVNVNANTSNMNGANSNTTSSAAWTNDDVINGDKKAWDLIKTKDYAAFGTMIDDNFIDVTPAAVLDKAGTIAEVKTFDLSDVALSDFKVVKLDNDAAVVTYTVNLKGKINGKDIPANAPATRDSTAVVLRGGKWYAVYHQTTPVEPPMTPPAAGANSNSANANHAGNANSANTNSTANAAGNGPLATTSDLEADEKMVWDAFEKKNVDGFAGVLTEDSLEVEPDGVYTKTPSVEMIRQMVNAGGFKGTLSDFKTVTLDADAKIVTYTVKSATKGFPAAGQRHSTVWINRGGKWMAAYHQGTPVSKGTM
jgi:hypothetical protein